MIQTRARFNTLLFSTLSGMSPRSQAPIYETPRLALLHQMRRETNVLAALTRLYYTKNVCEAPIMR